MPAYELNLDTPEALETRSLRQAIVIAVVLGILISGLLWTITTSITYDGRITPPQLDSLMYFQYAKGLAEGHAYRFVESDSPSTGSTSHLYPAVLSVFNRLGAHGDDLVWDSFFLCAVCFMATLVLVAHLAHRLYPSATLFCVILCALSGQVVVTTFGHSDMTLFVPLALGVFVAGLNGALVWCAILLGLCALCRPEGICMAGILFGMALVAYLANRQKASWARGLIGVGLAGLAVSALVFILNYMLTGSLQFQSVLRKGPFNEFPFLGAVQLAGKDLSTIFLDLFWGLDSKMRSFYLLPIVGPALVIGGLCSWPWKLSRKSFWLLFILINLIAAMVLLALSGWQGFMVDRHLGWCFPLLYVLVGIGVFAFWAPRVSAPIKWATLAVLLGFQAIGFAVLMAQHAQTHVNTASAIFFTRQVEEQLPSQARIGLGKRIGLAYYLPTKDIRGLSGIASPRYLTAKPIHMLEQIKHDNNLRFDYWLGAPSETNEVWLVHTLDKRIGQETTTTPYWDALGLYTTRWDVFDQSQHPVVPAVLNRTRKLELIERLDVGYDAHEQAFKRRTATRMPGVRLNPFAVLAKNQEHQFLEVGNLILGSDSFTIPAQPGRLIRVVMRVMSETDAILADQSGTMRTKKYKIGSPMPLNVIVNNQPSIEVHPPMACGPGEFDEVVFEIPGSLIRSENRIDLYGDFIVLGYWFYQ